MVALKGLPVLVCMLLVSLLQFCSSAEHLDTAKESWIVPNQRQSIYDCPTRYFKYAQSDGAGAAAGGTPTNLGEFAHMAAIGWILPNGTKVWKCGGSLIWDNWVLTAAHCAPKDENERPKVVRVGDLNLRNDDDNRYAQERKIDKIIRHPDHTFSKGYHDIALLRLESGVCQNRYVAPACIWNDDQIRFKTVQATGWGATSFAGSGSSHLLKVSLRPINHTSCIARLPDKRRVPNGLLPGQICAVDPIMDTCPGDSGGPLEVKLRHNIRITPFVVGVTSLGTACGLGAPAIYTRVAPYIPWIRSELIKYGENVTDDAFDQQTCALRYLQHREITEKFLKPVASFTAYDQHAVKQVSIHWNGTLSGKRTHCYGVIIDESSIVTLARCTSMEGIPPAYIQYGDGKVNAVTDVFRHPNYKKNSLYNDIGLLKLKDPLVFSGTVSPACLWEGPTPSLPFFDVSAHGLKKLIDTYPAPSMTLSHETIDVHATGKKHVGPNCSIPVEYKSRLEKGLTEEHFCFGADPFLVPGTCDQSLGGPIQSPMYLARRVMHFVYALNLFGRDCGYGESAGGVNLYHHRKWLESILLPKRVYEEPPQAPLIFLHKDLAVGDRCEPGRGENGICVESQYCPKMMYEFRTEGTVQFCQSGSLVCCPKEFIRNETDAEWREIDQCENLHAMRETTLSVRQNLVSVVWTVKEGVKSCLGTIITSRTIVLSADCIDEMEPHANVSVLPVTETAEIVFDYGFVGAPVGEGVTYAYDTYDESPLGGFLENYDTDVTSNFNGNEALNAQNGSIGHSKEGCDFEDNFAPVFHATNGAQAYSPETYSYTEETYTFPNDALNPASPDHGVPADYSKFNYLRESPTFRFATNKPEFSVLIKRVIIHPEFNRSTKQHNIALIQMTKRFDESLGKLPACLWTNTTHTPFALTQIAGGQVLRGDTEAYPIYSTDCERTFGRVLQPHELCVDVSGWDLLDAYLNAPALWKKNSQRTNSIPYLIGIASQRAADGSRTFLHTRMSSYVSWIKSVL